MIATLSVATARRAALLFALLIATEAAAQNQPPARPQLDARVLANLPLLDGNPVKWQTLAFSPDGRILVADGERVRDRNVRTVGATRNVEEFIQTWDLVTFRPDKLARVTDLTARRMVPRFSHDGRTLYAHATENQMRDSNEGGGLGLHTRTRMMVWPIRAAEPDFANLTPVAAGSLLALTVLDGGREMVVAEPEGGLQRWRYEKVERQAGFGPRTPRFRWLPVGDPVQLPNPAEPPAQFSADGSLFFAPAREGPPRIFVWDVQAGNLRAEISLIPSAGTRRPPAPNRARPGNAKQKRRPTGARRGKPGQNKRRTPPAANRTTPTTEGAQRALLAASQDGATVAVATAGPRGNWVIVLVDIQAAKVSELLLIGATPVTGLALSGDGSRLVYVSAGKATLRGLARGRNLNLPAPGARLSVCALSSNGNFVAAAADDGQVRLWKLSPPPQVARQDSPSAESAPARGATVLLESGPLPVYVQRQEGPVETRQLLRLTAKEAIFQGRNGRLERESTATNAYARIASSDRSLQWSWDAEQGSYQGPTVPPPPDHPVPAAQPFTAEQEALYLLAAARRQQGVALERSARGETAEQLAGLRQQATARGHHAASLSSHAASLSELYRELHALIPVVVTTSQQRREVLAEMNRAMIQMAKMKDRAEGQARAGLITGLLSVFVAESGLTTLSIPGSREQITDRLIHEHTLDFDLAPGLSEWGMSQAMASLSASADLERQMRALEELSETETGKRLREILAQRQTALGRFQSAWNKLAVDEMKLDLPAYSEPPSPEDSAALAAWLRQQSAAFVAASDRIDPLLEADLILLRSSPSRDPAALYLSAKQLIDLLPWIPAGKVYDPDRARLYGLAAGLVLRGVSYDARPRSTTDSYHRMAHRAVSFLDRALELYPQDPGGVFRGKRAIALAQVGRQAEALQQARQLVTKKPDAAEARFVFARLLTASGEVDRGLDELEKAIIELGLPNLEEVRQCADFPREHRRFRDLVDVQLEVIGSSFSGRVRVRNRSRFPLNDVTMRVDYARSFTRSERLVAEMQLMTLGPGEEVPISTESPVYVKRATEDGKKCRILGWPIVGERPRPGYASPLHSESLIGACEHMSNWQRQSWPTRNPVRPFKLPPWSMKHSCD